ncbi:MAG TPA: hypothetical protein ENO00_08330 [Deltaproteobacteria bacterium]|nr:hypothetical protein [Deltaproteobacteria bacterium]
MKLRTAFVRMVMGMPRLRNKTDGYRLMGTYRAMKGHKGTGKSIIATARKMNTMVYEIFRTRKPFDQSRIIPEPEYPEMIKAARRYALAV